MEIAGEMEVDVLHRHDLRIAAAGGAALHAKARPEARLAQADDRLLADMVERVAEPDRRRGLALAGRRRGDRGDEDQLAVGPVAERADVVERDLRLVSAIGRDRFVRNAELVAATSPIGRIAAACAISMSDFGFLCWSAPRATAVLLAECRRVLAPPGRSGNLPRRVGAEPGKPKAACGKRCHCEAPFATKQSRPTGYPRPEISAPGACNDD